jgi:predicted ATPase with chaperone activity
MQTRQTGDSPLLPRMIPLGAGMAPAAPAEVRDTGVDRGTLLDLALKTAATVPQLNTEWAARELRLPQAVASELLDQLRGDHLLEVLGQAGPFGYRYAISGRGRERAARLLEVSGYVGPAPVALGAYTALLEWQLAHTPRVTASDVSAALADLVLTPDTTQLAGLAISSGRSLFIFGPSGDGKTSLGQMLHNALQGEIWIPHALVVDQSVIRVFDPQLHQVADMPIEQPWSIDQRWVRIRRPLIIGGGELTLASLDLDYSPTLRYYEAPLHLKANGGTFLLDDFGRQRVAPNDLLNRWIIPLESRVDYLSLHTGQKIQVPFRLMLIVATNLDPEEVTDPAFLRRMGYRMCLDVPSQERYVTIFQRYAAHCGLDVPPGLLDQLLQRYYREGRELRCCEPRDLIERVRDICAFRGQSPELNEELLFLAWKGYFGTS